MEICANFSRSTPFSGAKNNFQEWHDWNRKNWRHAKYMWSVRKTTNAFFPLHKQQPWFILYLFLNTLKVISAFYVWHTRHIFGGNGENSEEKIIFSLLKRNIKTDVLFWWWGFFLLIELKDTNYYRIPQSTIILCTLKTKSIKYIYTIENSGKKLLVQHFVDKQASFSLSPYCYPVYFIRFISVCT